MLKKAPAKKLIMIGVIAVIAVLVVVFVVKNRKTSPAGQGSAKTEGIFSSIKDAIAKSLSLKCEYTVGTDQTIVYLKGVKMRIDGSWQGKKNTGAILKENKLWSWDNEKKEGIIMPLDTEASGTGLTAEGITANLETEKNFCRVAVFSDTVFDPPVDIKFQDLTEMLQKVQGLPK